jgi:hypothetical protein
VFGSDKASRVEASHPSDRVLDLTIYPAKRKSAEPMFHRRFDRSETKEVRLYLRGGDDVCTSTGRAGPALAPGDRRRR